MKRETAEKMNQVIYFLGKAFAANVAAKEINIWDGENDCVDLRLAHSKNVCYQHKTKHASKAVSVLIQNPSLPIKWGVRNGILYFKYRKEEISFHSPNRWKEIEKEYLGQWCGQKNKNFPFKKVVVR